MMLYFVFSGILMPLVRLNDMIKDITDAMLADESQNKVDKSDGAKTQKSQEDVISDGNNSAKAKTNLLLSNKDLFVQNQKKKVYYKHMKEEMAGIIKTTATYYTDKFVKCLKFTESKTSSININELFTLKQFFDDM